MKIFEIFEIEFFCNFSSWKINKFLEFFQCEKPKFGEKNWQLWNFWDVIIIIIIIP